MVQPGLVDVIEQGFGVCHQGRHECNDKFMSNNISCFCNLSGVSMPSVCMAYLVYAISVSKACVRKIIMPHLIYILLNN